MIEEEILKIMSAVLLGILKELNTALENKDFENYKYWSSEWAKFFTPANLNNLNEISKKL